MSSISDEKAVITLEVELKSNVTGLDDVDSSSPGQPFLEGVNGTEFDQAVKDQVKDAVEQFIEDEELDVDSLKSLTKLAKDLDTQGMANITKAGKNPEGFAQNALIRALGKAGPYGALAAAIITTLAATPEFISQIVQLLGVKGGPLNQDFRFSQEEQEALAFDRRVQFRRLTGEDPLITINSIGFVTPGDPDFAGNSLVNSNLARTARIGLRESSFGYMHGI